MLDFVSVKVKKSKNKDYIFPEFKIKRSKDLMIKGKSFYAIWDEERGYWTTNEYDVQRLVDDLLYEYAQKNIGYEIKTMGDMSSNSWTEWQKYYKSLPDNFKQLDDRITFANSSKSKDSYITHSLDYSMADIETPAYDELINTLYSEDEKIKIEWAIGSVINGDSKRLHKFFVLYGAPGSGKSTVLNIIQMMFPGYYEIFESAALTKNNNSFALEPFRKNPLIAIEHDGDLSKIENNTRLNSIVSHEEMLVNEKFKATYPSRFNSLLFIGTNKPVKITDAKSGVLRRLIDIQPSGQKIPRRRFDQLMNQIKFELGGIAYKCLKRYESMGFTFYDTYTPTSMMAATNDFFNFIEDNLDVFEEANEEGLTLSTAWRLYNDWAADAKVPYPLNKRLFKDELKNYFEEMVERERDRRNIYYGFKREKLMYNPVDNPKISDDGWLKLNCKKSIFDEMFKNQKAQYTKEDGTPKSGWDRCKSKLIDLDSHEIHYVMMPENIICIDFDIKNKNGEKDRMMNIEAAQKWPKTYAEFSKSGEGLHLYYQYDGDVQKLSRVYDENIEVKVFTGKASLRRKLSLCNNEPISIISSGLPLKEVKVLTDKTIKDERMLRILIKKNLNKEIHPNTKPSIDFIMKLLEDSYSSGLKYDVRDMRPAIQNFALGSTNNADYCLKCVSNMKFNSDESNEDFRFSDETPIVFYDIEIFPNLFIVSWKKEGSKSKVTSWINPTVEQLEKLIKNKLVGFNNRKYDNHMVYGALMGYSIEQLYKLSNRLINEKDAGFFEAYNLSYTDVYDFLSAGGKMSLKKWEIKLGIHHQELGYKWDEAIPEDKWQEVADYCENDVKATEAVWLANQEDWLARQILSEWAGLTPNHTTNNCTTAIIVGNDKNPQESFVYTDLGKIFLGYRFNEFGIPKEMYKEGVKIVSGKSVYKGLDPSEGGFVYSEPGMYQNVGVLDVQSMHPSSAIALNVFGKYTEKFKNIKDARVCIKQGKYEEAKQYLPEKLWHYLDDSSKAKQLANAMKTAINSVYGLTSAKFPNKLKDPRNIDNIVAKYGALFMIDLKEEVQNLGYTVIHIKTDSIKIANVDDKIVEFVKEFGKKYGFEFEYESVYEKICLVNESVYIAKEKNGGWTATGTQFQVPYVFKMLFSKEPIVFDDLCETKSVTTAMYLDFNEGLGEDEHDYRFVGRVGSFCPVINGVGGGILLRQNGKKFASVVGTKKPGKQGVYRWMESEMVIKNRLKDSIDKSYYNKQVDDAVEAISKFGNFEEFID